MQKCRWGGQSLGALLVQSRAVGWGRYTNMLLRQHGVWLSNKVLCVGEHTPKEEEGTIQCLHKSIPEMFVVIVRHCILIESCVCCSFFYDWQCSRFICQSMPEKHSSNTFCYNVIMSLGHWCFSVLL